MTIEQRKIHPEDLARLTETCIWLLKEEAMSNPSFIQLDWNMCGSLSRTVKQNQKSHKRSLVPTLKRICPDYVMLDEQFSVEEFAKTCQGMKFAQVAIVCGNLEKARNITSELALKDWEYPKNILVCVEEVAST